ncbi:hypothetical protein G7Y79_00041g077970 [Physcia stellaris]|nr:hypothetical protein G7Y79_00041g077970 [Physcia stellaris]
MASIPPTGALLYASVLLYAVFLYTAYFLLALLLFGCIFNFFLQRLAKKRVFGSLSAEEAKELLLEKGFEKDGEIQRDLEESRGIVGTEERGKRYGTMVRVMVEPS